MKTARRLFLFIVNTLLLAAGYASAQPARYQVFFIGVGSGWYATPTGKNVHGFPRIQGANTSADIVANGLSLGGAFYGVELKAGDQSFVTLPDIEKAIRTVATRINLTKPANPLLVFYIASHGISEGIAWSHFSIPGDFVYRGDPDHLDIDGLSNNSLSAGSLVDELQKLNVPFLVMLDSCRDGEEKHFSPTVLSTLATRNLNDVEGALRVMNEFRDTYPVLFSTIPGKSALTVNDPTAPDAPQTIGPLARRFALSTSPYLTQETDLSLSTFLSEMVSTTLDGVTTPAVTHSKTPNGAVATFLAKINKPHNFDVVQGTGSQPRICCSPPPPAAAPSKSRPARGTISFGGPKGDYVSLERQLTLSDSGYKISTTQQGQGDLQIEFERGSTKYDANFSTGSSKRFEQREYTQAQRYDMADPGKPGLEISGDGRGCNEIAGSFRVSDVEYGLNGTISKYAATFEQVCDDSKVPARGSISISLQ